MDGWNTTFLLGRPIFSGYVSFREVRVLITAQVAILMAKFHSPFLRGPPLTESQRQLCRGVGGSQRSVFQNRGADAAHEFGPFDRREPKKNKQDMDVSKSRGGKPRNRW